MYFDIREIGSGPWRFAGQCEIILTLKRLTAV